MRSFVAWGLLLTATALQTARAEEMNKLTPEEVADGWILLFDGQTTFGWEPEFAQFKDAWHAENGILTCKEDKPFHHLKSHAVFSDFVLTLDFRINTKGNSGIFFRAARNGDPCVKAGGVTGYEAQIDDNDPRGLLYQTGGLYDIAPAKRLIKGENEWRHYEITADGEHITTKINGELICDTMQKRWSWGHIGLQQHNPGSKVEFKNIKLKPLGLKNIYDGKSLAGWKVISRDPSPEKLQADWSVQDGLIHVEVPKKEGVKQGGQGQLETEADYANFTLQMDIRVNGKWFNSGVFFRSLPNTSWVGYESQIRNQWMGDKRDRPIDFGTGGIYNLKPSRMVVTNDNEFFKKTIIVHGRHMGVWLNGYQVTDFTDPRPENPNPREGYFGGSGKIALQSHDPTTNLDFKNIQIAELPAK